MKKLLVVVVILLVAAFILGCGGKQKAEAPEAQQVVAQESFQSPEQQAAKQAAEKAEAHQQLVADIQKTFSELTALPGSDWKGLVKKGSSNLQDQYDQFWSISGQIDDIESGKIDWSEVGGQEQKVRDEFRMLGLRVAKGLLATYNSPFSVRDGKYFGTGEGSWELTESPRTMSEIIRILDRLHRTPADIGMIPAGLRAVLLKDLRAFLLYARQQGKWDHSDQGPGTKAIFREALNEYGFSPNQLGLTLEEVKELKGN